MKTAQLKLAPEPTVKRARAPRQVTPDALGVIDQVRTAFAPENRAAGRVGAVLGGFVPVASYMLAHQEVNRSVPWTTPVVSTLVLGGLLYSAPTVYQWMVRAVGSRVKALGFVVLLEGILTAVNSDALAYAALALLVAINSVATATRLALGVKKDV